MKKQICFAGFGEEEIESLQPSLSALSGAWNCPFSPDASSALETLAESPFDAIVVNLTPGGIDDGTLLQEAAIRHPRTLRFVLGDVSSRELIANSIGATHQFISRPWKPRELVSIIERSLALDSWLANDKLRAFVPRLGKLPGLPSTYFEVLKRAESPHSNVESIAEAIARDPTLTARLLQMVNSPACGVTRKVTNPNEAVSRLGVDTVKSLVLCLQLFAQSAPAAVEGLSMEMLWRHSFAVAKLCADLVKHCIASNEMASEAYTAGLLHNIGQIVLATNLSKEYEIVVKSAREQERPLHELEMEELGVTSPQVGAYLLGLWGMPLPMVEATALHLNPAAASTVEFSLVTVVHVANVLAYAAHGPIAGLITPELDAKYLATLDLPKTEDEWHKLLAAPPAYMASSAAAEDQPTRLVTPPPPLKKEFVFPIRTALALAGAACLVLVVLAVKKNAKLGMTTGAPPAPAPTAASAVAGDAVPADPPAPTATDSGAQTATGPSPFDDLRLQSILYSSAKKLAMINGKTVEVGDRINDVKIVSIERNKVVLACRGDLKTLSLK